MKTITNAELREILAKAGIKNPNLADSEYTVMTEADFKKLNRLLFLIRLLPYQPEKRDCDDYADFAKAVCRLYFKNKAFGTIWADGINPAGYHAANLYINENKEVVIYEPQNAKIIPFKPTGDRILTII